jgi:hypothetical protein
VGARLVGAGAAMNETEIADISVTPSLELELAIRAQPLWISLIVRSGVAASSPRR